LLRLVLLVQRSGQHRLLFQEVIVQLTGHIDAGETSFTTELTNAARRAVAGKRRGVGTGDFS
jgi:hypothetical protein